MFPSPPSIKCCMPTPNCVAELLKGLSQSGKHTEAHSCSEALFDGDRLEAGWDLAWEQATTPTQRLQSDHRCNLTGFVTNAGPLNGTQRGQYEGGAVTSRKCENASFPDLIHIPANPRIPRPCSTPLVCRYRHSVASAVWIWNNCIKSRPLLPCVFSFSSVLCQEKKQTRTN